jgi:hypothetical protein
MTKEEVAFHEAGHVVACWALGAAVEYVTIASSLPDELGYVQNGDDGDPTSARWVKKAAVIAYAGRAAERVYRGAASWADAFSCVEGDCGDRDGAEAGLSERFPDAEERAQRYQRLALWLVRRRWSSVVLVAEALSAHIRLFSEEIPVLLESGRRALDDLIAGAATAPRDATRGRPPEGEGV